MRNFFRENRHWLFPVLLIASAVWLHAARPGWDFELWNGIGLVQAVVFLAGFVWVGQKAYVMYINILRTKQGKEPLTPAQLETEAVPAAVETVPEETKNV